MTLRKVLCVILCLAMVLGCLAACGEEKETPTTQATTEATEATEPDRTGGGTLDSLRQEQLLEPLVQRGETDNTKKQHTLMIYMVGSNLESKHGAASLDLLEIMESGVDTSKVNVVVYTGGAYSWNLSIPSDCNCILALTPNGTEFEIVGTTKEPVNTGHPQVLCDFLTYSYKNYPADSYSLICWDHGAGSLLGFGADELFKDDSLYLPELQSALNASPFANEKLAFIGFDACLMATLETAMLFSDYADYLVASEETEPGSGWDYTCLKNLDPGNIPQFLDSILSTYENSMRADRQRPKYTLSCMDLSAVSQTVTALDALFQSARQSVVDGNYAGIAKARLKAREFGLGGLKDLAKAFDMIDVLSLAKGISSAAGTDVSALEAALEQLIMDQVTNMEDVCGVSLYFPYNNKNIFQNGGYDLYQQLTTPQSYLSFLEVYADMWLDGSMDTQWADDKEVQTQEQPQEETPDYLYLSMTQEELSQVGRVYYNVFRQNADGESFSPVLTDCIITPEANGELRIPTNPTVVAVSSDAEPQPKLFLASQMDATTYVSQWATLMASDDILSGAIEPVQITLEPGQEKFEINSIVTRDADSEYFIRSYVDPDQWNQLAYYTYPMYPTDSESGTLLPWQEWERESSFSLVNTRYDTEFTFAPAQLTDFAGVYYAQLMVEDLCGETILSAWTALRTVNAEEVTQATENGELSFLVHEDHAQLVGYTGTDTAVQIPAEVEGKPVTVIGERALANISGLTEITLPDTVQRIESYAFAGFAGAQLELPAKVAYIGFKAFASSRLETVTLPAGLTYVAGDAFSFCSALTAIKSESSAYISEEGVLFSADGKTLVAYPCGGPTEYTVPKSIDTIGYGAFSGNWKLTDITLPEGLVTIESFGFGYCESLTDLTLPESLAYIGHSAFGTDIGMPKSDSTKTVTLGKNVAFIGVDAFSCFNLDAYEVDSDNLWFSSMDGCLLNNGGTKLISVPPATEGTFEVPYGVCFLDWHCLQDCNGITELILTQNVTAIDLGAGIPANLEKLSVNPILTYWGNLADYAAMPQVEIEIDPANYHFAVENGTPVELEED